MSVPLRRLDIAAPAITVLLLFLSLGLIPGGTMRGLLRSARSPEMNRVDREANAGSYYEGLISGAGGSKTDREEIAMRLDGHPPDWVSFHDIKALRYLRGDPLLFELKPNVDRPVFDSRFTTNRFGMRDRQYTRRKPPNTYRIALVGSSIDMGWGVGTNETYENRLEDWLNAHAAKRGLDRRFEIMNFAVAAYGPIQRLESFHRKATGFEPDLVLYSATMLDVRLLEINLCNALQERAPAKPDFVRQTLDDAGVVADDLRLDLRGELSRKSVLKRKLRPRLWDLDDATLGALADEARSLGIPAAMLIVPRASQGDSPELRREAVARHAEIAGKHGLSLLDLTPTFDHADTDALSIDPRDDHPNAEGHRMLFLALARAIVKDEGLYRSLFGESP